MVQERRGKYLSLRREFQPASVALVIVAESPPISGKYFYCPDGELSEPLFIAIMKQLGIQPRTKSEGLREFQERGWVLVDATYEPVNGKSHDRDLVITRDYPALCGDLKQLLADRWNEVPLALIKASVCKLLEPKLCGDGFKVLNKGRTIPFPSHGNQPIFDGRFREIVSDLISPATGQIDNERRRHLHQGIAPHRAPPTRAGSAQEQTWVSAATGLVENGRRTAPNGLPMVADFPL
jgi:hypothetical protein